MGGQNKRLKLAILLDDVVKLKQVLEIPERNRRIREIRDRVGFNMDCINTVPKSLAVLHASVVQTIEAELAYSKTDDDILTFGLHDAISKTVFIRPFSTVKTRVKWTGAFDIQLKKNKVNADSVKRR